MGEILLLVYRRANDQTSTSAALIGLIKENCFEVLPKELSATLLVCAFEKATMEFEEAIVD